MNLQPKFSRESAKPPHPDLRDSISSKNNLSTEHSQSAYKFLKIVVHEARLSINLSLADKMKTYTKIQIGSIVFQTEVDEQSHLNPHWDNMGHFEIKDLQKLLYTSERTFGNVIIREYHPQTTNRQENKVPHAFCPKIIIGVYDCSLMQDFQVGEVQISLPDVLKGQIRTNWYPIYNRKQEVGSIYLAFGLENEEEYATISSQDNTHDSDNKKLLETKINQEIISQFNEKETETQHSTLKKVKPKKLLNDTKTPSSSSGSKNSDFGTPKKIGNMSKASKFYSTLSTQNKNKKADSKHSNPQENQLEISKECLSDKIEPEETSNSDDMNILDLGETNRSTHFEIGENISLLEELRRNNQEVAEQQRKLKGSFEKVRAQEEMLCEQEKVLKSRKNDLKTREECLVNERRNLSLDFANLANEQAKINSSRSELQELEKQLGEMKDEDFLENERTIELEEQVKQISLFYQREVQNMKRIEHDMYKKLIEDKIEEYNNEINSEKAPINEDPIVQETQTVETAEVDTDKEQEENQALENQLQEIRMQKEKIQKEIESRKKNIQLLESILLSHGN